MEAQRRKERMKSESIGAFLQQALKCIEIRQGTSAQLFKFLTISKQFLRASRRYPVFHLAIGRFHYSDTDLRLCFNSYPLEISPTLPLLMTLDRFRIFAHLLKPKYFRLMFNGMSNQFLNECLEFFRNCSAKLSIQLLEPYGHDEEQRFLESLVEFAERLHQIECNCNLLLADRSIVPKLKLENFEASEFFSTLGQMTFLLSELRTSKLLLHVCNVRSGEVISEKTNYVIKHLTLNFENCPFDVLETFYPALMQRCPNLQTLSLKIAFHEGIAGEIDSGEIVRTGLAFCALKKRLREIFGQLKYLKLILVYAAAIDLEQYNDSWKTSLKDREEFRNSRELVAVHRDSTFEEVCTFEEIGKHSASISIGVGRFSEHGEEDIDEEDFINEMEDELEVDLDDYLEGYLHGYLIGDLASDSDFDSDFEMD